MCLSGIGSDLTSNCVVLCREDMLERSFLVSRVFRHSTPPTPQPRSGHHRRSAAFSFAHFLPSLVRSFIRPFAPSFLRSLGCSGAFFCNRLMDEDDQKEREGRSRGMRKRGREARREGEGRKMWRKRERFTLRNLFCMWLMR